MKKFRFLLLGFLVVFLMGPTQVYNQENINPASGNNDFKSTLPEITIKDNGHSEPKHTTEQAAYIVFGQ